AFDIRAAQRAVEDPIARFLILTFRTDRELDGGAVERSAANVAGATIAGVRAGELAVFAVQRGVNGDVALWRAHGEVPAAVDRRRRAFAACARRFRREANLASVDEDALYFRFFVEDRLVGDDDV